MPAKPSTNTLAPSAADSARSAGSAGRWASCSPAYAPLALLVGYLLGSIPFGLLLTHAAGLGDVRKIGSGNIGATNVLRTGHKGLAAATLLLDALKGTVAVLLVVRHCARALRRRSTPSSFCLLAGLGAFLGHIFPVWLRFRGGKGVATYIGVLLGAALAGGTVVLPDLDRRWRCARAIPRWPRCAATVAVVLYYLVTGWAGLPFILIISALIFLKHHANIRRLLEGEESKIGARS